MSGRGAAPMISSAGRDHVLLSKQFCVGLVVVILCAGVLFYRMEQAAVKKSLLSKQHITQQNEILAEKAKELKDVQKSLIEEENDLKKLYDQWLKDDGKDLTKSKEKLDQLQAQIKEVQLQQQAHMTALYEKEAALQDKESLLTELHDQLRQKNVMIKTMKKQIVALNGTLPQVVKEMPDDDDWAW